MRKEKAEKRDTRERRMNKEKKIKLMNAKDKRREERGKGGWKM